MEKSPKIKRFATSLDNQNKRGYNSVKRAVKNILGLGCVVISLLFFVTFLSLVVGSDVPSIATVVVGGESRDVAFTPDSKYAYVLCPEFTADSDQVGTVRVISADANNALFQDPPRDNPVVAFPFQLLVGSILATATVVAIFAILVKKKKIKRPYHHKRGKTSINAVKTHSVNWGIINGYV